MEKKLYYTLLTILILSIALVIVIAAPPNGHDSSQIDFGTTPVSGFKLSIPSNVIIGANANGALRVRHIDGKGYEGTTANDLDILYLQYSTGKAVNIGNQNKPADLYVSGNIIGSKDWTPLPLGPGWVNYADHHSSNYQKPEYRKIGDIVYLRGLVDYAPGGVDTHPPNGNQVGTLPAGFKPKGRLIFSQSSHTHDSRVDVNTDGNILVYLIDTHWVPLDGIFFSTT